MSVSDIIPGQLMRWREDEPWMPRLVGRPFLVVGRFMRRSILGRVHPAIRVLIGDRLDWYYEDDIREFAEVISDGREDER